MKSKLIQNLSSYMLEMEGGEREPKKSPEINFVEKNV